MEEIEIKCRKCSLPVRNTNRTKKLRCPRCHAEITLHTNHNDIQWRNQPTRKQGENQDRQKRNFGQENAINGSSRVTSLSNMATGKRALICGVSYTNQKHELKGTINDVRHMKEFLQHQYGFPEHSIRVLAENNEPGTIPPTRQHMENGLRWLVEGCKPGDSLVFFFSGHGLRQREFEHDEQDGYDETICPLDYATNGMILDNDINAMIVKPLIKGVILHAIIDACHSGTVLDLRYVYNRKLNAWRDDIPPNGAKKGTSGGLAISLSACLDDQLAVDTDVFTKKGMTGAMTYCFIDAVKRNPNLSYHELLISIEETMPKAYKSLCIAARFFERFFHQPLVQEALLSSSSVFDVNTRFSL